MVDRNSSSVWGYSRTIDDDVGRVDSERAGSDNECLNRRQLRRVG